MKISLGKRKSPFHDFFTSYGDKKATKVEAKDHAAREKNKHQENCKK